MVSLNGALVQDPPKVYVWSAQESGTTSDLIPTYSVDFFFLTRYVFILFVLHNSTYILVVS